MAHNNKFLTGLSMVLAVSIWGCATQPASTSAEPTAGTAAETPPAFEPLTTTEVINIRNLAMKHQRTMFSVSRGTYTYYMGGTLTAVIDDGSGTLVITPDDTDSVAVCEYSREGTLKQGKTGKDEQGAAIKSCDTLLKSLQASLEAP